MAVLNPQEPPNQGASVSISQLFFVELCCTQKSWGQDKGAKRDLPLRHRHLRPAQVSEQSRKMETLLHALQVFHWISMWLCVAGWVAGERRQIGFPREGLVLWVCWSLTWTQENWEPLPPLGTLGFRLVTRQQLFGAKEGKLKEPSLTARFLEEQAEVWW